MKIPAAVAFTLIGLSTASLGAAQTRDTTTRVKFGGFVDAYYAWDFARPLGGHRTFASGLPFTTQPARHGQFDVTLAFIEAALAGESLRGRLALHAGTSVDVNYATEPRWARHVQEAFIGIRPARTVWIDGGIFFSHIGAETWISRDNLSYTRSLTAEYSPYYQTGVRLIWNPRPALTTQLNVVNGWQHIRDDNSGIGAGLRVDWIPGARLALTYYNLVSEEDRSRLRVLNGGASKVTVGRMTWILQGDLASQASSNSIGHAAHWYGLSLIGQARASRTLAFNARVEHFDDDEQIVIKTGTLNGSPVPPFRGFGASLGVDVTLAPRLLWRTELRGFENDGASFPSREGTPSRRNVFAVTSLALTLLERHPKTSGFLSQRVCLTPP